MSSSDGIIIVGAGIAGYSAAQQLRSLGYDGRIQLLDREPTSYDRPALSKDLFADAFTLDTVSFAPPEDLAGRDIETRFGVSVVALDADAKEVTLEDGTKLGADSIVLATGGTPRDIPLPGTQLADVYTLRTFADAQALRQAIDGDSQVVIIGAGLIGAELASSLRQVGAEVTLIEPSATPLAAAVGDDLASYLHAMHEEHGARVLQGITREIFASDGRLAVAVDSGETVPADVVVLSVGIVPDTHLAEQAGLEVDNGVLVDERFHTSKPGIYAVGDSARMRRGDTLLHRHEHWEAAKLAGEAVAHAIVGQDLPAEQAPWFWSDRYGVHLEATGRLSGSGELVVRRGEGHPAFFMVDQGLLVGAATIDDSQTVRAARRLIDRAIPVTTTSLKDPGVSLRQLIRAA